MKKAVSQITESLKLNARVDSRLMCPLVDFRHRVVMEHIDRYHGHLSELGAICFSSEQGKPRPQGGTTTIRYALLSEDQCYFLLTLMRNNEKVVAAKLALVKAFKNARAQLANRDLARLDGKEIRRIETDSIKLLVDYATAGGSKSANHYFSNVTRMTNKLLGIETGSRDSLDASKLKQVAIIESVVDLAIRDGLKAEMNYKDIYQLAKNRAALVVPVLSLQNNNKT